MQRTLLPAILLLAAAHGARAQSLASLDLTTAHGVGAGSFRAGAAPAEAIPGNHPLASFLLNDTLNTLLGADARAEGDSIVFRFGHRLAGSVRVLSHFSPGWKSLLAFRNTSPETLVIANVVPFGEGSDRVYITAAGPSSYENRLSRSALFRPGCGPVGVVLPDDAWELGFCDIPVRDGLSLAAIARRSGSSGADERRFRTILPPGASVRYDLYADLHPGGWHEGARLMFHDRWIYDLPSFDDTLFRRADLRWVRHAYLMALLFAWDERYYDRFSGTEGFGRFVAGAADLLGRYDVFTIWPTWPRLGVDERNQFDLYRDLPGGLVALKRQADVMHRAGGKYFISYNPWDESTRREAHVRGIEDLLRKTDADGVVLDTWGESSKEFQAAADRVKPGIVLYSEGMAVPADMPGIVAGRVHDALYMPPPLNMNRLIKPDFAIFRVMQVAEGRLHREAAICLFNGYGAELNIMRTGRPAWMDEEYRYLGLVLKTLRENSGAFQADDWMPLLHTTVDSVWVNQWPAPGKTVYTVYGLRPEGFAGPLVECPVSEARHYVSVWHHREVDPVARDGRTYLPATVEGFSREWLGTRREGNVDCIAWLPRLLDARTEADSLFFGSHEGARIVVTAGDPSYAARSVTFPPGAHRVSLYSTFGRYEGKITIQLFQEENLLDERIVGIPPGTPRLISTSGTTPAAVAPPRGMTEIPAGRFTYAVAHSDDPNPVIPYPEDPAPRTVMMKRYFIDTYPVTNGEFRTFIAATRYRPTDTVNFLRDWTGGQPPASAADRPVTWVSLEDARAFARWAGKRLPTAMEWQYAAQGTDGRKYPWGNDPDSTRCNPGVGHPTPVGAYPSGKSPFGVMDLVGNVWQLTSDVYDNGSYYFVMMRGGSYYRPTSSVWYVRG
ncbi:MAG TPA: SUMF1/EgtB/PvdO family nonheme iron enzyme, partial [Bacteroidota bacterium]|nr:SUMF1/EgtB/PvdO family nonheme iron enzyme [Bacteroidota bacterium]